MIEGCTRRTCGVCGAGQHILAADQAREAHQSLSHQFRMFDHVGRMADDAGNELAAGRQLRGFPHPPLVLVARISHLDAIAASFDAQHQIDDVFERHVGDVRRVKAAPANVIADAFFRQSLDGVIERLDADRRPFAILLELIGREGHVVHVRQERVVDLHDQAGIDDRLVFLAQRFGELEQKLLVVAVVFVLVPRHGACRRHHREEGVSDGGAFQTGLEDLDILSDRRLALVGQRPDADHSAPLREFLGGEIFGVEIRKHLLIAAGAARSLDLALLDAAETVEHIERPAAEFAELAVADDVDAGLLLTPDHLGDGLRQAPIERGLIDLDAIVDRFDVAGQFRRAHQAAHMGGENALLAC
jgi:hypothetical protein